VIVGDDTGYVYIYKVKNKYGDDFVLATIGLFSSDTTNFDLQSYHGQRRVTYNKYEDLDLQLDLAVRRIEMSEHQRYRVDDEPKYEDLNTRPRYYRY
jgi:hypothetical protein